ncbi:MAG: sulfatase [bacterium]|nr:sulfatase [bacterium]
MHRLPSIFVLFSIAPLLLVACGCSAPSASGGDVLLIVLDTTRADHLSAYGYDRLTTPNLDRLAADGERYEEAYAQAPWTLPSMATILTGYPPHRHGAGKSDVGMFGLREDVTTLAQRMRRAGYSTAAFVNVVWCSPDLSSLDRGFDTYDFHGSDASNVGHRDARRTTDAVLDWFEKADDRPAFVVVHYFDPHLTYDPPAPYDTMFDAGASAIPRGFGSAQDVFGIRDGTIRLDPARRRHLVARYDGELRHVDEQFGRLRAELERRGRWEDALVIVVADHGEEFWEHGGFEHGHAHYRETLRVPLIVRRPGGPVGRVSADRVRQLDVAPTVIDFAGIEAAGELPGRVLGSGSARFAVAEGSLWGGDLVSVRSDLGTLISHRGEGTAEFFAPGDPFELRPAEPAGPEAERLTAILGALPGPRQSSDDPRELTDEQLRELRSLGYLQ